MNTVSQKAKAIFVSLVDDLPAKDWDSRIEEACRGDAELSRRVRALLLAHREPNSRLEHVAIDFPLTLAQPLPEQPGNQIGPYELLEQIGEGGMGVVYLAEQSRPVSRKVALKIIKPGIASQDVFARFEAERQALAMMDHPNIAKVHDGGATELGQPYFVMELVSGLPITEFCDEHNLSTADRLQLFTTVCRAVQHAHQKGIIHRDLKPSNIIVTEIDGVATPKVIDFGVAKAMDQKLSEQTVYTQFTQLIGTPLYMSPEQASLGVMDVDTRSDVYSLGVLLYELVTGCTPFDGDALKHADFDEMRRIIREDEPLRPSSRISTLNAEALSTTAERHNLDPKSFSASLKSELDWIVMKALEKDRDRRYESAIALADDVERHLNDEPIAARPASRWYQCKKFYRRNRALVGSLVGIATALFCGAAVALAGFLHAVDQRDVARQAEEKLRETLAETVKAQAASDKTIDVLWQVLGGAWQTGIQAERLTLREAMQRFEDGLAVQLKDQPEIEIKIRSVFAENYRRSQDFQNSDRHLERALELAQRVYGERSLEVADIYTALAGILEHAVDTPFIDQDKYATYARLATEIYAELDHVAPPASHAWFLRSKLLRKPEQREERRQCLEEALRIADVQTGPDPNCTRIFARGDLANFLHSSGGNEDDLKRAKDLLNQALQMVESGEFSGDIATVHAAMLMNRARFYWGRDQTLALRDLEKVWDIYSSDGSLKLEFWGHRYALDLARLHVVLKHEKQARDVLDEIKSIAEQHGLTKSLAECCMFEGWMHTVQADYKQMDYTAASASFEEALDYANAAYHDKPGTKMLLWCHFHLAQTYRRSNRLKDAREHYQYVEEHIHPVIHRAQDVEVVWGIRFRGSTARPTTMLRG